jgi:hypothetical protein
MIVHARSPKDIDRERRRTKLEQRVDNPRLQQKAEPFKLYWQVQEKPTGQFRSFQGRGWPAAYYDRQQMQIAAQIYCDDDYIPANVKSGRHAALTISVADYSEGPRWQWRKMRAKFATLEAAKAGLLKLLEQHTEIRPKEATDGKS